MEGPVYRISVRNLVEFVLRSGDLDSRRGSMDKEAMQKGSRLHRKIQKSMGSGYQAEVPLKWETKYEDMIILVEGRADGVFRQKDQVFVDEIKGIYGRVELLEGPFPVHRAQAMCYARMLGEKLGEEQVGIQMTYANLDTEEQRRFQEGFSMEELRLWYQGVLDEYHKWLSCRQAWRKERNNSMKALEFPFPYRPGQRKLVSGVYHTISARKQIFIQAPTGIGKTMSAIFPAVRAVGEGKGETVFYLTAKTITRTVAEEAFSILKQKGLRFQVLTLTAKDKICFQEKAECAPDSCPYAKGHFDRVNDAVYDLWTSKSLYDRESIWAHAKKWQVCPFEMSLDLALWVDGVICDYNYVFDPNAHLKRFFGEGNGGEYIFLIDEAHNLVERGRQMYSASLCRETVMEMRKKAKTFCRPLEKALGRTTRQLLEMKKECETYRILAGPGLIPLSLLKVQGELEKLLEERKEGLPEELLDFYFSVRDFLNIVDLVDENYVVYTEVGEDGRFRLNLFCVNPAANLQQYLSKGVGAVLFSATLLPMTYYRRLLSARTDDYGIYASSPFPKENRCILVGGDVTSRYTRRTYEEYRRIAQYIAKMAWQKKGNYMAFFPSYRMMEEVYQVYEAEFSMGWVRSICQSASMGEGEKEAFLEEFQRQEGTLLAFCIMGGSFSEGIDLMGEQLIGAAIVGTGIPQISSQREILKEFYDRRGENGFDHAYRFPGMNKVLQAAGRVIRTYEDVGVILLLDERFREMEYRELFPVEWSDRKSCTLSSVDRMLEAFWQGREETSSL
ncbi:MAG: ATP-dependent DNA helicase [Eubacteriales bacterium]|nr:ATP-dependent DNA helicase [Eubacteriales bacterium]